MSWRFAVLAGGAAYDSARSSMPGRTAESVSIAFSPPEWHDASKGIRVAHVVLPIVGGPDVRVEFVRITPAHFDWRLRGGSHTYPPSITFPRRASWTIDSAAPQATAFSAGLFSRGVPWGWVVRDGRELQAPGTGPLARSLVITKSGRAALLTSDSVAALRSNSGAGLNTIALAIQSYPLLLDDGRIPEPLSKPGHGVDHTHRDARFAVGILPNGDMVLALTRLRVAPDEPAPYGPTSPEMAQIMRQLGCVNAMLLDGGLSSQLIISADGGQRRWPGLRAVALGVEAVPR